MAATGAGFPLSSAEEVFDLTRLARGKRKAIRGLAWLELGVGAPFTALWALFGWAEYVSPRSLDPTFLSLWLVFAFILGVFWLFTFLTFWPGDAARLIVSRAGVRLEYARGRPRVASWKDAKPPLQLMDLSRDSVSSKRQGSKHCYRVRGGRFVFGRCSPITKETYDRIFFLAREWSLNVESPHSFVGPDGAPLDDGIHRIGAAK